MGRFDYPVRLERRQRDREVVLAARRIEVAADRLASAIW
jgi:hypothetical protein